MNANIKGKAHQLERWQSWMNTKIKEKAHKKYKLERW